MKKLNQQLGCLKELALAVHALKRAADEFAGAVGEKQLSDKQIDTVVDYVIDMDPRSLTHSDLLHLMSHVLNATKGERNERSR